MMFIDALYDLTRDIIGMIAKSLGLIVFVIQALFPVVISCMKLSNGQKIICSVWYVLILMYIRNVSRIKNKKTESGMPLPPYKLTDTDSNGFVEIISGREEVAIIYLSDIEEYIDEMNRRNKWKVEKLKHREKGKAEPKGRTV